MSVTNKDRRLEGISLSALGGLALLQEDLPHAVERYTQAHAIHSEIGNRRFEAMSLSYRAMARWKMLRQEGRALSMAVAGDFQQALALHRANQDGRQVAASLVNLGEAWLHSQNLPRARQSFVEAQEATDRL